MTVKNIRTVSIVLAIIGLVDSIYLTWVKMANRYALCGPIGDCESVNSSQYSEIAGVPIALIGAAGYILIILLIILEARGGIWKEYGPYLVLGITLAGSLYSIYLTYLEVAVIQAICPYCVVSAIVIILLFILSVARLIIDDQEFEDD